MKKNVQPPRSFRLVCSPEHVPLVEALLQAEGYGCVPEPFSSWCRVLTHEPVALGRSLAALFGCIYIQDRSAMLPALALNPPTGAAVLDMCASPGGKTGFCAQLVGTTGFVLANEPTRTRLGTLRVNMQSLGLLHVSTCIYAGERLPLVPGSWDWILLDPPCSGWGTARKHPEVHRLWRGNKIKPLVALQRRLLEHAARLLAPGGVLVYSTCTTNEDENEAQIRYACEHLGFVVEPLLPFDGFVWEQPAYGGEGALRVDGLLSAAQGFYIARLRKPGKAQEWNDMRDFSCHCEGREIQSSLDAPCVDISHLHGTLTAFGDTARLVPCPARTLLPESFQWQAAPIGKITSIGTLDTRIRLGSRLRTLLPHTPPENAVVIEDIATLRALCHGQSVYTHLNVRDTGLYWRDLPLGRVGIKNGRIVWNPNA